MTTKPITRDAADRLREKLRGRLVLPADPGYDEARALHNAMFDPRPAGVVQCADVADVVAAVRFGRDRDLDLAVRCGGHNGAGLGSVDGGLVVDVRPMNGVRVDPVTGVTTVAGGALLGGVDHATHAFGRAVPAGIISTTGVGGLTLGGGIGHLSRACGLSVDNLLGADVVLADGRVVHAGHGEHPELFWALRGGGGNFGVVTSFTFRSHPVSHVVSGPTLWELDDAPEVMRWYREFLPAAPREISAFLAFMTVPPVAPFPEELHLRKMCAVVWCCLVGEDRAAAELAVVHDVGRVALHAVGPMPLPAWQSAFDGLYPPGQQQYWRGDFVAELPDEAIARHVEWGGRLPTWQSTMHLYPIDGAVHDPATGDTAWAYRDATWAEVIFAVDPEPAMAGRLREWAVGYWEAVHPYTMGGSYVNFMMAEGDERVRATYRGNYDRLAAVKAVYDPDNAFHVNQNIAPAASLARPRPPSDAPAQAPAR